MSDTEEVVLPRASKAKKDTKPEIAREKLKEKRERLKKEKENALIEEAKKRLAMEEEANKQAALKEQESKKADPVFQMSQQMKEMMDMWKATMATRPVIGDEDEDLSSKPPPKVRKPRSKKAPEAPKPPTPPPAPKPKKPRAARKPKQVIYEEDSPSNQFVGHAPVAPAQPDLREPAPQNHLINQMMSRRYMNTWGGY